MPRPHNVTVLNGEVVISTTPKALRTFLAEVAAGRRADLTGKVLANDLLNLTALTAVRATQLSAQLFPEAEPTVEQTAAVVVMTVPPA